MISKFFLTMVAVLMMIACGHDVKKADIAATTNPTEEIQKLESDINSAQNNHVDVLASEDFKKSQKSLAAAKEDQKDGDSQEEILENIGYARGYLNRANETANQHRGEVEGILKTREMAITAGARNYPQHREKLGEIDDSLRDELADRKGISTQDYSQLQNRYMDLELASLKTTNLGTARAKIEGAKNDSKAKSIAPNTLRQAELDLTNAENMIAAHRDHSENFKSAVDKSNASAQLLVEVLAEARKPNETLDENTALGIVQKNRQISSLQGALDTTEAESKQLGQALQNRSRDLSTASRAVAFQKALDRARKEFSPQEAEVYQQGDKLLIRLKAMNFSSGRSELPPKSMALLAKVKAVASELNPQEVVIEGHTDSVGTATANEKLSQARAEAVESYLQNNGMSAEMKAQGYGFKKPIASNRNSRGRAQNRRVDIIVTPSQSPDVQEVAPESALE